MSVNVYLAGKFEDVVRGRGKPLYDHNWRDDILVSPSIESENKDSTRLEWEIRENGIANGINCTGAFFFGEHGLASCENHGWKNSHRVESIDDILDEPNKQVFNLCKSAIDKSDILFAWIDRADCHGTLTEIGYAYQKVKTLAVVYATKGLANEVWFPSCLADIALINNNHQEAFWTVMKDIGVCSEYIYIAWEQGTNNYKIGRSCDPVKRIDQLNSGTKRPNEIELLRTIPVRDSCKEESFLHRKFSEYCIRGEWFNLHPKYLDYLMNTYHKHT